MANAITLNTTPMGEVYDSILGEYSLILTGEFEYSIENLEKSALFGYYNQQVFDLAVLYIDAIATSSTKDASIQKLIRSYMTSKFIQTMTYVRQVIILDDEFILGERRLLEQLVSGGEKVTYQVYDKWVVVTFSVPIDPVSIDYCMTNGYGMLPAHYKIIGTYLDDCSYIPPIEDCYKYLAKKQYPIGIVNGFVSLMSIGQLSYLPVFDDICGAIDIYVSMKKCFYIDSSIYNEVDTIKKLNDQGVGVTYVSFRGNINVVHTDELIDRNTMIMCDGIHPEDYEGADYVLELITHITVHDKIYDNLMVAECTEIFTSPKYWFKKVTMTTSDGIKCVLKSILTKPRRRPYNASDLSDDECMNEEPVRSNMDTQFDLVRGSLKKRMKILQDSVKRKAALPKRKTI